MNTITSIIILCFFAIITHHLVAWAGSILHEIGDVESGYAVFTFRDDRNMPMTTNILMNICIPNVLMVFIYMLAQQLEIKAIEENLIVFIISFFVYRMILICVILRRKEMYSFPYEFCTALVSIGVGLFLIKFFFASSENVFIEADALREELWFAILIVLYQFFKQILNKRVTQDKVLSKGQISRYVINKFKKFYSQYNDLLEISPQNRNVCIFLYAIMIFEDYNRGPIIRFFERMKIHFGQSATVGIMQIKSELPLTDEESVIEFYKWAEERWSVNEDVIFDEDQILEIAWEYNNDESYAKSVVYIYKCLYEYIDEVPKYRSVFCIREKNEMEVSEEENISGQIIRPYTQVICNTMAELCASVKNDSFINLEAGCYNVLENVMETDYVHINEVYDGNELIISDVENVYFCGNNAELMVNPRYATVLTFVNCKHIVLDNLKLGHAPERGECVGAVLQFMNCSDVQLKNLELYGCGTYGLMCCESSVSVQNCTIHSCTYGAIELSNTHCIMDDVEIYNCSDVCDDVIGMHESNVVCSNTKIYDCSSHEHIVYAEDSVAIWRNVEIVDCNADKTMTNLENEMGIVISDCELDEG